VAEIPPRVRFELDEKEAETEEEGSEEDEVRPDVADVLRFDGALSALAGALGRD
jgi:hypothetical protein